jgi:DNA replication protein DnaC
MDIKQSLKTVLKRLRLSGMLSTLPERSAYAKGNHLSLEDFLELCLQDEIDRRDQQSFDVRLKKASFGEEQTLMGFDWDAPITFDRNRVRDLFSLGFLERKEDVLFLGPVGVGKTFLASALGHAACRAGKRVLFMPAGKMLKELHQSRADHSHEKAFRRLLAPDLLIVDDFGLRKLECNHSNDLYELIVERHRKSSTIITSNRSVEEWAPLFDDPMLAQSAIDRIAHNAYQIIMEGESYRRQQGPGKKAVKSINTELMQDKTN